MGDPALRDPLKVTRGRGKWVQPPSNGTEETNARLTRASKNQETAQTAL